MYKTLNLTQRKKRNDEISKKVVVFAPEKKRGPARTRERERERETKRERREPPTMSSGVVPNDACKPAFDKVRLGKIKYVTFKIDDKAEKTEVCEMGETKVRATSSSRDVRRALWGLRNDRRETEGERALIVTSAGSFERAKMALVSARVSRVSTEAAI